MFEKDLGSLRPDSESLARERGLVLVILGFDVGSPEKKVASPLVAGRHCLLRWSFGRKKDSLLVERMSSEVKREK